MKILLIDNDPKVVEIVTKNLKAKWFEVNLISTAYGEEGVELVKKEFPEIVILDLMLEDINGFEVLQQIRGFSDVLVVILTVNSEVDNIVRGLQEGADDYIIKPFSPEELVARMKALIRRKEISKATGKFAVNPLTRGLSIDFTNQTVSVGGSLVRMDPDQYALFYLLVTNKGVAISKQALLKKVFPEKGNDTRIVDVFINRIRERLEENPNNPKIITNEGTTGYKFVGSYSTV
ncbi:response regulator transcription factor [Chloroflexota bacterium]